MTGLLQITAASICFGLLGIFGKLAFHSGLTVGELLSFRFLTASLVFWFILAVFRRPLIRINRRQLITCLLLGICGYSLFSTLYFTAIQGVSASLAALLLYTYPVLVALGAHFLLKEQMTRKQWMCLPLVAIGLLILLWGETTIHSWMAVLAGLGAALSYSFYILASRRYQRNISPLTSGLYVMSFAALGLLILHRPDLSKVWQFSREQIFVILGIALISTILPLVLFLSGLQKLKSSEASVISTLEPITAIILSSYFFHESISWYQWPGALLVLIALIITVKGSKS